MGAGSYVLGGLAGLVFGLAVAWCNMLLTKRSMQKQDASAIMGVNVLRQVINIAALALVFLLRNVIPLPVYGTLIGTALGLSVGNVLFVWLLTKKMEQK